MLLLQRCHNCHQRFDQVRALDTLRATTAFAPQHPRAHYPLGRVVRRLDAFQRHTRPQHRAQFEARPTDAPRSSRCHTCPPASSHCSTSRRSGLLTLRKRDCCSGPSRTRCPWLCRASPISWKRPPRPIIASMSCNRCAPQVFPQAYRPSCSLLRVGVPWERLASEPNSHLGFLMLLPARAEPDKAAQTGVVMPAAGPMTTYPGLAVAASPGQALSGTHY